MSTSRERKQNDQLDLELAYLVRSLIKNKVWILLCGMIVGMLTYMITTYTYKPTYSSTAILAIANSGNDTNVYKDSAIEKAAGQFQEVFNSNILKNRICESLGVETLPGKLKASVAEDTNILVVKAAASNPGDAFRILREALDQYSEVTEYVISYFCLEELLSPTLAGSADNWGSWRKKTALGVVIGILFACACIVFVNIVRDDIKSEKNLRNNVDAEMFGVLYYEKKRSKKKKDSILITNPNTSFVYSENIRKISNRLDFKARSENKKVFQITSITANEGKSTVAANIALSLADKNKKVLLIDCDLRKPGLFKIFEKNLTEEMEISEFLNGHVELQKSITRDNKMNLYYMFNTKSFKRSDQMLASEQMSFLIEVSKKIFDYVIIDSAPMSVSKDAEVLAAKTDGVLLVVRQGVSLVPDINDALDALRNTGTEVLGCIFNNVQTKLLPDSEEHGYGYGYGYGYGKKGYGWTETKRKSKKMGEDVTE